VRRYNDSRRRTQGATLHRTNTDSRRSRCPTVASELVSDVAPDAVSRHRPRRANVAHRVRSRPSLISTAVDGKPYCETGQPTPSLAEASRARTGSGPPITRTSTSASAGRSISVRMLTSWLPLWHRIIAARVERLAFEQPANGEPSTAQNAVRLHRLDRVLRARRVEAAMMRQYRRQESSVDTDRRDQDVAEHGPSVEKSVPLDNWQRHR
jgi:hypothetical protein